MVIRRYDLSRDLSYLFGNAELQSGLRELGCDTIQDVLKTPFRVLMKNEKVMKNWSSYISDLASVVNTFPKW